MPAAAKSGQPRCSPMSAARLIVAGLQAAVVCRGEKVWDIVVDKYGRVQVIFRCAKSDQEFHDNSLSRH